VRREVQELTLINAGMQIAFYLYGSNVFSKRLIIETDFTVDKIRTEILRIFNRCDNIGITITRSGQGTLTGTQIVLTLTINCPINGFFPAIRIDSSYMTGSVLWKRTVNASAPIQGSFTVTVPVADGNFTTPALNINGTTIAYGTSYWAKIFVGF